MTLQIHQVRSNDTNLEPSLVTDNSFLTDKQISSHLSPFGLYLDKHSSQFICLWYKLMWGFISQCEVVLASLIKHYLCHCSCFMYMRWTSSIFVFIFQRQCLAVHKAGGVPLDMNQFRMLYNTCKIPGVTRDSLVNYFKTGNCSHQNCSQVIVPFSSFKQQVVSTFQGCSILGSYCVVMWQTENNDSANVRWHT